jgi:hypothetical protein
MESIRNAILKVLNDYAALPTGSNTTRHLIVNHDQTEFWLLKIGWNKHTRIHTTIAHLEIKNDMVWIHRDETEEGIATELEQYGISKQQIVLAFFPPEQRRDTEYAVQ